MDTDNQMKITRAKALTYICPRCKADRNTPCIGSKGQERKSVHISRMDAVAKYVFKLNGRA